MTSLPEFFDAASPAPEDALRNDLLKMITDRDHATPRHRQVALGPSEIGHPCLRKMAYGLTAAEKFNPYYDPLPSIIGTATHAWLADAAELDNKRLAEEFFEECGKETDPETGVFKMDTFQRRWIIEKKVEVAPGLSGSCDLYDSYTKTIIDWKLPGQSRFAKYSKEMPAVYRAQVHMYGKGMENSGFEVKTVAVALLPRGGSLKSMHLWSEPYNARVAEWAVDRRNTVIALLSDWDVENHPERYHWFAKSGPDCAFCAWYRQKPESPLQCEGA